MNPTLSLSWEMLARHRWMTVGAVALLLLAPWLPPVYAAYAAGIATVLLIGMTGHGFEGRAEGLAGLFPRRQFVLPVSTPGLMLPPMIIATTTLLAGGLLMTLTRYPSWPMLLAATLAAWLQVVMWTPMPLPWLRLWLVIAMIPLAATVPLGIDKWGWVRVEVALWPLLVLAYPAAWAGVSMARRGVGVGEPAVEVAATREVAPFATAAEAQAWFEWRRLLVPVLLSAGMNLLALPVMIGWSMAVRYPELVRTLLGSVLETVGPGWIVASCGLILPMIMPLCGSMDFGRLRDRTGSLEMSPFQAGKPVDDAFFLAAKYGLVTRATLYLWGAAWLIAFVFCAVTGELPGMAERMGVWFGSPWAGLIVLPALAAGLFVLSWMWSARALWGGLWTSQVAAIGPVVCGLLLPVGMLSGHGWVAALGLTAEALCMAFLARHSPHRGKVAAIVVVCLAAALLRLWPVVLLAWPFAGLLLAPTALRRNRHR